MWAKIYPQKHELILQYLKYHLLPWFTQGEGNLSLLLTLIVYELYFSFDRYLIQYCIMGTSLVAQWLRVRLPMRGTQVQALVQEDPACCGATKPVHHNYWAHAPQLLEPVCLEPVLRNRRGHRMRSPHTAAKSSPRSLQLEKTRAQQQSTNAAKNK